MKIRQLNCIEFISEDLGSKTTIEIYDEKYLIRFRWSITPNRNKINVDVLLKDGDWRNLIVQVEVREESIGFNFLNEFDTTLEVPTDKMQKLMVKIHEEIELLKSKRWL